MASTTRQDLDARMALAKHADKTLIAKLTCEFCSVSTEEENDDFLGDTDMDELLMRLAKDSYKQGWRVVNSAYYQLIGAACPACVKKKDEDR